jgi:ring-1,2-phenylacetyl-CoA epoxidase subunit PaaD
VVSAREADVRAALARVMDPEIPTCPITELGIVKSVVMRDGVADIELLPTFAGCPALDVIREDVERAVRALGVEVRARFVNDPPWTVDRVTPAGFEALREYGIAAPGGGAPVLVQLGRPAAVACPYCGARETEESSAFGPTPCRTIRYCPECRNPFEGFKPKRAG